MNPYSIYRLLAGLILMGSLISCGGGGGKLAEGGIGGTGISIGKITKFGSVFVNDVEFNTDNAVITVDGAEASERDLGIGMVVEVQGTFDENDHTGTAKRITYEGMVEGTVDAIDLASESLVVLGQTVHVNNKTVFERARFDDLAVGNIVEVSGFTTSSGAIQATRIAFKSEKFILNTTELKLTGVVENFNESAMSFRIGGLDIDFGHSVVVDPPDGGLANGSIIRVESGEERVGGVLIANRVEGRDFISDNSEGLRVEIEGVVTDFTSPSDFKVNGLPVRTDENTLFENGRAEDIALDTKLAGVSGTLNADGVLLATEIEFDLESTVEIETDVQAVDPENRKLELLGITVSVNNRTAIVDSSDAAVTPFRLQDIRIGDRVIVIGNPADGNVTAIRIERWNPAPALAVGLEGPVTAIAPPTFEILGVILETTDQTVFMDNNDIPITPAEFFAAVQIGSHAEIEGTLASGNVVTAHEAKYGN